ncbi:MULTISPECIES: hypothetical protein [unclassified Kitasatospora]|uniref:hypothetical protein n=1 Tax=Kitasatospora sp. NPDC001261 TaxID=3364012 RepID=UPI00368C5752
MTAISSTVGDNFEAKASTDFDQIPTVKARDQGGSNVTGARIHFAIAPANTGSVFAGDTLTHDTTTDGDAIASSPTVKAGPTPGEFTITVTTPDGPGKATFLLTVTPV